MSSRTSKEMSLNVDDVISGYFGSYQIKELKGEGTYGRVARCEDLSTNQSVAVKISRLQLSRATKHEASLLRQLSSLSKDKNVVKFIKSFQYQGHYCLVLEHLDQSLQDLMKSRRFKPLHISDIRYITKQLLVTFKELAKRKLVHGDLKPDNIMLVDHKNEPFKIKLIDFGVSTTVKSLIPGYIIQAVGYRAPEVTLGTKINEAIDMWALGCVLAFLYLGQHLFPTHCEYQMMRIITQILGMPDGQQLQEGIFADNFFRNSFGYRRLLYSKEYTDQTGKPTIPAKNVSRTFTSLKDMMAYHPQPSLEEEKEETKQFLDFLTQLLQVNPVKRITPEKALTHPCIKQKPASTTSISSYIRSINWSYTPREAGDAYSSESTSSEDEVCSAWTSTSKTKKQRNTEHPFDSDSKEESIPENVHVVKQRKIQERVPTGWVKRNVAKAKESTKTVRRTETTREEKVFEMSHPSVVGRMDLSSFKTAKQRNIKTFTEWHKTGVRESQACKTYSKPALQNENETKSGRESIHVGCWPCRSQWPCGNKIKTESAKTPNKSKDTSKASDKPKKKSLISRVCKFFRDLFPSR